MSTAEEEELLEEEQEEAEEEDGEGVEEIGEEVAEEGDQETLDESKGDSVLEPAEETEAAK